MIPDATPGIPPGKVNPDPERLERAQRAIEKGKAELRELGEGVYRVRSFSSSNTYQVAVRPVTDCHCRDAIMRGEVCKHIILAMIVEEPLDD